MSYTSRPLAFPDCKSLDKLFEVIETKERAPEALTIRVHDEGRTHKVPVGPYCTVNRVGGYASVYVRPTPAVMKHIEGRMILSAHESVHFKMVFRDDGTVLVLAENNLIIGSTWLALLPVTVVEARLPVETRLSEDAS